MPEINFKFHTNYDDDRCRKIRELLEKFFEKNFLDEIYIEALFVMYKKKVEYYIQKKNYNDTYI